MLSDKTISAIANSLFLNCHRFPAEKIRGIVYNKESGYDIQISEKDTENIAMHMHLMNLDAIEARYGTNVRREESAVEFKYNPMAAISNLQLYVSLKSYLYQCADIDDYKTNELYRAFTEYLSYIADEIISAKCPEIAKMSRQ